MSAAWTAPEGFVASACGRGTTLLADPRRSAALRAAGLDRADRWRELLQNAGRGGRGSTAVVALADGGAVRVKQMRRGGLAAPLWRDRIAGQARLLDNLRIPDEVVRRGLAAPRVWALLAVEGPPGLYRGWLAAEEIPDAIDVAAHLAAGASPDGGELEAVLRLVRRMHDAGIEHRDLNLGNLLIRGKGAGVQAFVVDFDRARLHDEPLSFRARQRALRRIERSYVKVRRDEAAEDLRRNIYTFYAGDDRILARRLSRGRWAGRLWIRAHALAWRR